MRDIFEDLDKEYEDESIDYSRIYSEILQDSPFLITVGDSHSTREVVSKFVKKLSDYDSYRFDVEFVDGIAQAAWNRETLEEAVLVVQRDAVTLNYECRVKPGETIYRLYPGSLTGLSLER